MVLHIQLHHAIVYQHSYQQQLLYSGEGKLTQLQQQAAQWRQQYEQQLVQVQQRRHSRQWNIVSLQSLSQVVASKPSSILLTAIQYSANQLQIDGISSSQEAVYNWLSQLLKELPGQTLNEPQVRWSSIKATGKPFQIDISWKKHA